MNLQRQTGGFCAVASGLTGEFENKRQNGSLILVVEDDLLTLPLERFVPEEEGFAVREAKNGEEGNQALNEGTKAHVAAAAFRSKCDLRHRLYRRPWLC